MDSGKTTLNVVVTGGTTDVHLGYHYNTSNMIHAALPDRVAAQEPRKPAINIIKYPELVPCIYSRVVAMAESLASGEDDCLGCLGCSSSPVRPDLIIHMGMSSRSRHSYRLETLARRDGYDKPGQDGVPYPKALLDKDADGRWKDLPETLHSAYDMHAVRKRVLEEMPEIDVLVSDTAGLYFCEFALWATLAALHLQGQPGKCIFLHVPQDNTDAATATGVRVVEALIRAVLS